MHWKVAAVVVGLATVALAHRAECDKNQLCAPERPHIEQRAPEISAEATIDSARVSAGPNNFHNLNKPKPSFRPAFDTVQPSKTPPLLAARRDSRLDLGPGDFPDTQPDFPNLMLWQ
jgi:hypothetical protein